MVFNQGVKSAIGDKDDIGMMIRGDTNGEYDDRTRGGKGVGTRRVMAGEWARGRDSGRTADAVAKDEWGMGNT